MEYPNPERVRIFYAQSIALVRMLMEREDVDAFNRLTAALINEDFPDALRKTYRMSMDEAERLWRKEMDNMEATLR